MSSSRLFNVVAITTLVAVAIFTSRLALGARAIAADPQLALAEQRQGERLVEVSPREALLDQRRGEWLAGSLEIVTAPLDLHERHLSTSVSAPNYAGGRLDLHERHP